MSHALLFFVGSAAITAVLLAVRNLPRTAEATSRLLRHNRQLQNHTQPLTRQENNHG